MRRRASVCQLYRLKEGRKERVSERPVWLWIHIGPRLLNFPLLLVRSGGINNIISRLCWEWYGFGFQSGWVDGWEEGEYSVQHSSTKAHWKWIESRFSPLSLFLNIYAMRPVLAIWLTWHSETCKCWAHGTYNHPSIYLTRSHHWHLSASQPPGAAFVHSLVSYPAPGLCESVGRCMSASSHPHRNQPKINEIIIDKQDLCCTFIISMQQAN